MIWQRKQKPKKQDSKKFFAFIQLVDQDGLMEIKFNRAIFVTPNISDYNNETMKIKVESTTVDEEEISAERNITRWWTTDVSSFTMKIQIEF